MYDELTVQENIKFSATLFSRKDPHGEGGDYKQRVQDVISILGLSKIRNSVIGNSEVRGISGASA
jgi:ABC-type multidrug transport system ATPase subunit